MVEPAHSGLSPRLGIEARIFLNLFQDLSGAFLSVVGYVCGDFINLEVLSLSKVLIEVGCMQYT